MKKAIVSIFVVVAFAIYSIYARGSQSNTAAVAPAATSTSKATDAPTSSSSTQVATKATASPYKDGTYTGNAADAYYGNVQVRVTISSGKLTNLEFLQYPKDHHESIQINQQAMPLLKQEAIQAQSDKIDGVSGATDTSEAFIESLTSALNQARV
jgi:uncharacterized protein with FMN-binding domain